MQTLDVSCVTLVKVMDDVNISFQGRGIFGYLYSCADRSRKGKIPFRAIFDSPFTNRESAIRSLGGLTGQNAIRYRLIQEGETEYLEYKIL